MQYQFYVIMNKKLKIDDELYLEPSNENIYTDLNPNEIGNDPPNFSNSDPKPAYLTPEHVETYAEFTERHKNSSPNRCSELCHGNWRFLLLGSVIVLVLCIVTAAVTFAATSQLRTTCNVDNCAGGECRIDETGQSICVVAEIGTNQEFRILDVRSSCQSSWVEHGGKCYREFLQQKTWYQSQNYCNSIGASLVKIENRDEMDFVESEFPNFLHWIGLKRYKSDTFLWEDGSEFIIANWSANEPNNKNGVEDCVNLNRDNPRGWSDSSCHLSMRFICEMTLVRDCGLDDWFYYDKSCYAFQKTGRFTWYDAQDMCQNMDAELVSLNSLNEYNFVISKASESSNSELWIGLSSDNSGIYDWEDGTVSSMSMWQDGKPSALTDRCVKMNEFGYWIDSKCEETKGFICEKRQ